MRPANALWGDDLELILGAAREAGEVALGFFRQSPEVWWKNEGRSPVSAADFAANDRLQSILARARPNYGWLSEETDDDSARLGCETLFVIDPIDGTRAFIAGEATWCVSVAVVHRGRPVAGVLVAPALGEEFCAAADGPSLKNGRPVTVMSRVEGSELALAADEKVVRQLQEHHPVHRVKHVPSLAYRLAMVADGRIDATVVKPSSHDWDLAAADLILQQAGGALTDLDGALPLYNREIVSHDALFAGSSQAGNILLPHLAARRAG